MIINLSDAAGNVMLDALSGMLDGGSVDILSDDGVRLAAIKIPDPATSAAKQGEIEFRKTVRTPEGVLIFGESSAIMGGKAMRGRLLTASGGEVFTCDVSDEQGDAVIRLNTIEISPNGPVRIKFFRLAMP